MTANVSFAIASKADVLLLPVEAVRIRDGRSVVLIGVPDSAQPMEREVGTGLTDGKNFEVVSGLREDEVISIAQPKSAASRGTNPFVPVPPRQKKRTQ